MDKHKHRGVFGGAGRREKHFREVKWQDGVTQGCSGDWASVSSAPPSLLCRPFHRKPVPYLVVTQAIVSPATCSGVSMETKRSQSPLHLDSCFSGSHTFISRLPVGSDTAWLTFITFSPKHPEPSRLSSASSPHYALQILSLNVFFLCVCVLQFSLNNLSVDIHVLKPHSASYSF